MYTTVKAKVDGSSTDPGDDSHFKVQLQKLVDESKVLKGYHKDFLARLKLKQGVASADYTKDTGKDCATSQAYAGPEAGTVLIEACAAKCSAKPYVSFISMPFDAAKTNWEVDMKKWYDKTTNNGVALLIPDDKATGCVAFSHTTVSGGTCLLYDKAKSS